MSGSAVGRILLVTAGSGRDNKSGNSRVIGLR